MAKKGHSEEQILRALRQAEAGTKVSEICREHGISDATFYIWKKKYSGLGLSELRELRQLREENGKLKRLVADLSLDRHILQEIVQKSCKAPSAAGAWAMDTSGLCAERTPGGGADEGHSKDFAIPEPTTSSGCSADAAARAGDEPGAFRISKANSDLEKRRLAGQSQAHLSALHRGWAYGADQITQEAGAAVADSYTQGDTPPIRSGAWTS
jgi:putative transposase